MSEIKFRRDTSFRKTLFVPDSFAHPAKMDSQLLLWIVERYTKPGETILDPMFGSGTTMLACIIGRNVIGVELESKFCDMARANWEKVRQRPQLGYAMGECLIIQGDARNLEGLLADAIISSPPYSDSPVGGGLNTKPPKEGHNDQSGRSPKSPSQAGAGRYDAVITSPPYAEAQTGGGIARRGYIDNKAHSKNPDTIGNRSYMPETHGQAEGQIGNLPYGDLTAVLKPDCIITSPPYEGTDPMADKEWFGKHRKEFGGGGITGDYVPKPVDCILTSPPYEGSMDGGSRHTKGGIPQRDLKMKQLGSYDTENKANIGNLYGETYLEAMSLVYAQCFAVLRPQGLMVLVTKNFLREQKEIRLDLDTITIAEKAGFNLIERLYRHLPSQSFWRILYRRRFPSAPVLDKEDILVFKKGGEL